MMAGVLDHIEPFPVLGPVTGKPSVSTFQRLVREALAELAESDLDGEQFNAVVDAFVRRNLL